MKPQPTRQCCVTREKRPQGELLRFVSDGAQVWFDRTGKAPGRGAYMVPCRATLEQGLKKRSLSRALEAQVPPTLADTVATALQEDVLQQLALAKKASKLVIGLENVLKAQNGIMFLIVAANAGEEATSRTAAWPKEKLTLLSKDALEKALNVSNCTVVGLTDGRFCPKLRQLHAYTGTAREKD